MFHFCPVSFLFSYTNTNIFPGIRNCSYMKASTLHSLRTVRASLLVQKQKEVRHLHILDPGMALFLFGKIGFEWVHSLNETLTWSWGEKRRVHHLNQPHCQGGDRCCSEIRPYSRKFTDSAQGFCILFSINGQKNSTHIPLLMMQSGKNSSWDLVSYRHSYTIRLLYKCKYVRIPVKGAFLRAANLATCFLLALGCIHFH